MRSWPGLDDPRDIAARAVQAGAGTILVLDLGDVGMNRGVSTLSLCRDLVRRHPQVAICAGGGVRSQDELVELADAGLHAAVVASALHDGCIPSLKGFV